MVAYHAVWDLVYLFGFQWDWYRSTGAYIWQQSICWTFILLSGFCQALGKKRSWKRGATVFLAGVLISLVTWAVTPESRVLFGVLTLLGSCMLLTLPLDPLLRRCKPAVGLLISGGLFFLTKNVNAGYLGFGGWNLVALPQAWYRNLATAYLGFPGPDFFSTDYFSLFPWCFLFAAGYFLCRLLAQRDLPRWFSRRRLPPAAWIGRHSLLLYLLHQPALYALFTILFGR